MELVIASCEDSAAEFFGQGSGGVRSRVYCFRSNRWGAFGESPEVLLRIIVGSPVAQWGATILRRFIRLQTCVEKKGQRGGGHAYTYG